MAVGLASSGAGLGTILVNLGLDMLLDTFSWRDALRICCGAFCPLLFLYPPWESFLTFVFLTQEDIETTFLIQVLRGV